MVFDGSQINLFVAFIGGVITFFASCLLPLVPTYLAYLAGLGAKDDIEQPSSVFKRKIFVNGVFFTLGFILVFVLLGATVNTFGRQLNAYKGIIQQIGGIFFIFVGLFMLEIIKPLILLKELKLPLPKNPTRWQKVNSLLVGITFGFAWTPCIGPVLAVILFWASQAATLAQGVSLLFVYGLGLATPFLIIALGFESFAPK